MSDGWKPNEDASDLVASAQHAAGPNYLGSLDGVNKMMREWASETLTRFDAVGTGTLDRAEAAAADKAKCHEMGAIFVGRVEGYTTVEGWNGEGLANYLRWRMGSLIQDGTDEEVIAQAFAMFVHSIYDILRQWGQPGRGREWLANEITEACRSFTWLLVGMEKAE